MYREIVKWPSPGLKQKSKQATFGSESCSTVVADLKDTFRVKDGYGLAAPQIGYQTRIIVVNPSLIELSEDHQFDDQLIMINPELKCSGELVLSAEACFSVPDLTEYVKRYESCRLEFTSESGDSVVIPHVTGLAAFCVQHEVDHLDGKLFVDRLSRVKRNIISKRMKKRHKRKESLRLQAQKEWDEDVLSYSSLSDNDTTSSRKKTVKSMKDRKRLKTAKNSRKKNRKKKK